MSSTNSTSNSPDSTSISHSNMVAMQVPPSKMSHPIQINRVPKLDGQHFTEWQLVFTNFCLLQDESFKPLLEAAFQGRLHNDLLSTSANPDIAKLDELLYTIVFESLTDTDIRRIRIPYHEIGRSGSKAIVLLKRTYSSYDVELNNALHIWNTASMRQGEDPDRFLVDMMYAHAILKQNGRIYSISDLTHRIFQSLGNDYSNIWSECAALAQDASSATDQKAINTTLQKINDRILFQYNMCVKTKPSNDNVLIVKTITTAEKPRGANPTRRYNRSKQTQDKRKEKPEDASDTCSNCGGPHVTTKHLNITCHYCKKVGHMERCCRKKASDKSTQRQTSEHPDTVSFAFSAYTPDASTSPSLILPADIIKQRISILPSSNNTATLQQQLYAKPEKNSNGTMNNNASSQRSASWYQDDYTSLLTSHKEANINCVPKTTETEIITDTQRIQRLFIPTDPWNENAPPQSLPTNNTSSSESNNDSTLVALQASSATQEDTSEDLEWIIDSGATVHLVGDKRGLRDVQQITPKQITGINGTTDVYETGTFIGRIKDRLGRYHQITATVCIIPGLKTRIFSLRQILNSGAKVEFKFGNSVTMRYQGYDIPIIDRNNLWFIKTKASPIEAAYTSLMEWHYRCAHRDVNMLNRLQYAVTGMSIAGKSVNPCPECMQTKLATRKPFKKRIPKPLRTLEIVGVDLLGPLPSKSRNKNAYVMHVIDHQSNFVFARFLQSKDQATKAMDDFIRMIGVPEYIRSDNGGEFIGQEFKQMAEKHSIKLQYTSPYTPQQNSKAEGSFKTMLRDTEALLKWAELPNIFWEDAWRFAIFCHNRILHGDSKKTPYEILYGNKPSLAELRRFGCECFLIIPKSQRRKLEPRTLRGIFLGFAPDHAAYLVYCPEKQRFYISRNVNFLENNPGGRILPRNLTVNNSIDICEKDDDAQKQNGSYSSDSNAIHTRFWSTIFAQPKESTISINNQLPNTISITSNDTNQSKRSEPMQMNGSVSPARMLQPLSTITNNDVTIQNTNIEIAPSSPTRISATSPSNGTSNNSINQPQSSTSNSSTEVTMNNSTNSSNGANDNNCQQANNNTLTPEEFSKLTEYEQITAINQHRFDATQHKRNKKKTIDQNYVSMAISSPIEAWQIKGRNDEEKWKEAMEKEISGLFNMQAVEIIPNTDNKHLLPTKWQLKIKENTSPPVYKARIVARGDLKEPASKIDKHAPTIHLSTLRTVLAIAARNNYEMMQLDVTQAFLHGKLDQPMYLSLPYGLRAITDQGGDKWTIDLDHRSQGNSYALKLNNSLYGLDISAHVWNKVIVKALSKIGLHQSISDPCLFISDDLTDPIYAMLWVDDILIVSKNKSSGLRIFNDLKQQGINIRINDESSSYIGLQIHKDENGIAINCSKKIQTLLEKCDMINARKARCPNVGIELKYADKDNPLKDTQFHSNYRSLVGSLQWISTSCRPDISINTSLLSRHLSNPNENHMNAVNATLRYLNYSKDYGIQYPKDGDIVLRTYADATWASDEHDRTSVTGIVHTINNSPVSWTSKKQTRTAQSSMEAEAVAIGEAVKDVVWLRQLLSELGYTQKDPTMVYSDSMSAIQGILNRGSLQYYTKHVGVKMGSTRDVLKDNDIELVWLQSSDMPADGFTKQLKNNKFQLFKDYIVRNLNQGGVMK